ncbi:Hypothetical predicted protein [Mytilus galloprovincialis]|uniref:Uncharacterized protein n=1 Tax=Mytilus galloprovincialis TaxID=29158 RepID=A0A8B6ELR6_MYTGA|nr:Hypothetical predicted protein [Mytilus galloprovincialis]
MPKVQISKYLQENWVTVGEMWSSYGRKFYHEDQDTNNLEESYLDELARTGRLKNKRQAKEAKGKGRAEEMSKSGYGKMVIDDVQQRNLQSGEQVPVRNIWIRERSVEGKITLRRNHTQLPLTVGSYTEEAPAEIEMLTVEGFTLQEEDVLLVCTDESGDIKDYLCARYLVEALFILDEEEDITISMSNILPASVRVEIVPGTSEGSRINNISLV